MLPLQVFPWVLADYTSPTLDLGSPASFRDLSKPMGRWLVGLGTPEGVAGSDVLI